MSNKENANGQLSPREIKRLNDIENQNLETERKRAKALRQLRQRWLGSRNGQRISVLRGMRSYSGSFGGGYSFSRNQTRAMKEIQNKDFIRQRQGETQLNMKIQKLQRDNQKLQRCEKFLKDYGILSLLDDNGKLKPEAKEEIKILIYYAKNKHDIKDDRITLRQLINGIHEQETLSLTNGSDQEKKRPEGKLSKLTDSPYNLYK